MKFLTFNLWHGLSPSSPVLMEALEPGGRRQLREKLQIEVLSQLDTDIHFFQEANPVSIRARTFARDLDCRVDCQADLVGMKLFGIGLPLNLHSGLVTAVKKKWGLRPVSAVSLSRPGMSLVRSWGSWQLREERFALFNETLLPGWGRVLLINTHFHHGLEETDSLSEELARLSEELELSASAVSELKIRLAKGNQRREQELDVLVAELKRLEPRYEAVVLGGDINSCPESVVARRLLDLGFRDVWAEAHPGDPGLTFDAANNQANHLLQREFPLTLVVEDLSFSARVKEALLKMARAQEFRPRRIDYLWIRSKSIRLEVKSAKLFGQPQSDGMAPSDHFGVCADIEAV